MRRVTFLSLAVLAALAGIQAAASGPGPSLSVSSNNSGVSAVALTFVINKLSSTPEPSGLFALGSVLLLGAILLRKKYVSRT